MGKSDEGLVVADMGQLLAGRHCTGFARRRQYRRPEARSGGGAPYQAGKGGSKVLARVPTLEWSGLGVTVNAVGPAIVDTDLSRRRGSHTSVHLTMLPGRPIRPGATGVAVAFLATDEAARLTGQILCGDAGRSAH